MKAGNVSIMAVATVAVALCLLFSWVYLDDGDDGTELRAQQVGDVTVWMESLESDGGSYSGVLCTQTLVAAVGDIRVYLIEYDEGGSHYVTYTIG